MQAEIRHPQTTDSPHNLAHREKCPLIFNTRTRSVRLVLEAGANFLTQDGGDDSGRTVHLVPCPECIGPLDEPLDPRQPDLGSKGLYPAGPFE